jgi:hypothetical protein
MYSLFDSYFPSIRTVYVVSDSQLAELKQRQAKEELTSLHEQRVNLDRAYEQRKEVLDVRVQELTAQVAALSPAKEEEKAAA